MAWDAWGDPALAKPLPAGIRSLLEQALGVSTTEVTAPRPPVESGAGGPFPVLVEEGAEARLYPRVGWH